MAPNGIIFVLCTVWRTISLPLYTSLSSSLEHDAHAAACTPLLSPLLCALLLADPFSKTSSGTRPSYDSTVQYSSEVARNLSVLRHYLSTSLRPSSSLEHDAHAAACNPLLSPLSCALLSADATSH